MTEMTHPRTGSRLTLRHAVAAIVAFYGVTSIGHLSYLYLTDSTGYYLPVPAISHGMRYVVGTIVYALLNLFEVACGLMLWLQFRRVGSWLVMWCIAIVFFFAIDEAGTLASRYGQETTLRNWTWWTVRCFVGWLDSVQLPVLILAIVRFDRTGFIIPRRDEERTAGFPVIRRADDKTDTSSRIR